jgi:hypothetical protein
MRIPGLAVIRTITNVLMVELTEQAKIIFETSI